MAEPVDERTGKIDYDLVLMLDAEDLAEQGVLRAYDELAPHLAALGVTPRAVTESVDPPTDGYSVSFDGEDYRISGDGLDHRDSWGLATFALFDIANRQLVDVDRKFFAINGGNDLGGIFLTPVQADRARRALPSERDWPYLPTQEPQWFGMFHG